MHIVNPSYSSPKTNVAINKLSNSTFINLSHSSLSTDKVQLKPLKFTGSNGDPFTFAYSLGSAIKDVSTKKPGFNPLETIVNSAGGVFNLYHLYKLDTLLHDIKGRLEILQDTHLSAGITLLESSLHAAGKGKKDSAFRDLGHAKASFSSAAVSSTSAAKRALAHEFYAQICELEGLNELARSSRDKADQLLVDDAFEKLKYLRTLKHALASTFWGGAPLIILGQSKREKYPFWDAINAYERAQEYRTKNLLPSFQFFLSGNGGTSEQRTVLRRDSYFIQRAREERDYESLEY